MEDFDEGKDASAHEDEGARGGEEDSHAHAIEGAKEEKGVEDPNTNEDEGARSGEEEQQHASAADGAEVEEDVQTHENEGAHGKAYEEALVPVEKSPLIAGEYVVTDDGHEAQIMDISHEKGQADIAWLFSEHGFLRGLVSFPPAAHKKFLRSDQVQSWKISQLERWNASEVVCTAYTLAHKAKEKGYIVLKENGQPWKAERTCRKCGGSGHNKQNVAGNSPLHSFKGTGKPHLVSKGTAEFHCICALFQFNRTKQDVQTAWSMEGSGYHITPLPMESRQCIKILPPDKKHDQSRRCGGWAPQGDLEEAQRLNSMVPADAGDERIKIIKRIILLRVCKNGHRKTLEDIRQGSTLENLAEIYGETLVLTGIVQSAEKAEDELFEPYHHLRHQEIVDLLPQDMNPKQCMTGPIYVLEWPRVPGLVKIGYAKNSAGKRINIWQHCHPEARLLYEIDFAFPERMETLIHIELADKTRCLRVECPRYRRKHTEWFEATLEEAKRVINGWHELAGSPLYKAERTLSREWRVALQSLPRVTMATLSQHSKGASSGNFRSAHRDAEGWRTASSRPPTVTENIHSSSSSAPQSREYFGIDELAADLARTRIFRPTPQEGGKRISPARIPPA